MTVQPTTRASDAQSPTATLAHQIERVPTLAQPVADLVHLFGLRIYVGLVLLIVLYLQNSVMISVFWLATMTARGQWHVSQTTYVVITSIGLSFSVIGLPLILWLVLLVLHKRVA